MNLLNITKYNYRYIDYNTPIHYIHTYNLNKDNRTPNNSHYTKDNKHYKDLVYYTVPFTRLEREYKTDNTIVSFACPYYAKTIQQSLGHFVSTPLYVSSVNLKELAYHACILKMPLIVVLSSSCDIDQRNNEITHELFYTKKQVEIHDDYTNNDIFN
jgi:hypothetical protein